MYPARALLTTLLVFDVRELPRLFGDPGQASWWCSSWGAPLTTWKPAHGEPHQPAHLPKPCMSAWHETHTNFKGAKRPGWEQSCPSERKNPQKERRAKKFTGVVHQVATESHREPPRATESHREPPRATESHQKPPTRCRSSRANSNPRSTAQNTCLSPLHYATRIRSEHGPLVIYCSI